MTTAHSGVRITAAVARPEEAMAYPLTVDYRASHRSASDASIYHRQFSDPRDVKHLYWMLEQRLLSQLITSRFTPADRVLDFACGTGRILGYLRRQFSQVYGVDVSQQMLNIARQHVPDAKVICADVTTGEANIEQSFDLITAFRFFLNAEPSLRTDALRWIRSHLADDGLLICNFHLNPRSLVGLWRRLRWKMLGWEAQPTLSLTEAIQLLDDHGFEVRQTYGYGLLYYGRHHLWAPASWLLPIENALTAFRPLSPFGRNLLLVAAKK